MRNYLKRFMSYVSEDMDGCWLWQGEITKDGYGRFHYDSRKQRAHRFSYELFMGKIPNGLYVLHRCDNRKCVNPEHLFVGTQKENMRDCVEKGRFKTEFSRGSRNGASRLTEDDVANIKHRISKGEWQRRLADEFGVGKTTIWDIAHERSWAHIKMG